MGSAFVDGEPGKGSTPHQRNQNPSKVLRGKHELAVCFQISGTILMTFSSQAFIFILNEGRMCTEY